MNLVIKYIKNATNVKIFIVLNVLISILLTSYISLLIQPAKADETVSASVPPRASDFEFNLSSPSPQPLGQNENITYQITYGAEPSAAFSSTSTIVASWNNTKAPDNSQLLDYVIGSASNAFEGVLPVVDLVNKTITWSNIILPAGTTDQTVTFELKTITGYSKTTPFTFDVHAYMSNQYDILPIQTLRLLYAYNAPLTTPGPTAIPTITQSPSPTPTPQPTATITNVSITGITDTKTGLQFTTDIPSQITVLYGTSSKNLTKTVSSNGYTLVHILTLDGLEANTTYYFQVLATSAFGMTTYSNIFTFHTAKTSNIPNLENNIIVISSNGSVLISNSQQESDKNNPLVILTANSDYSITYTMNNPVNLKSIDLILTNNILGERTVAASPGPEVYIIPMVQKTPTQYVASLQTLPQGYYTVTLRLIDLHGNIIEKPISLVKIIPRLSVYAQDTMLPLPDARVFLYYYDLHSKSYLPITPDVFGTITNPSYTNELGQIATTLPPGKYKVDESALFYNSLTTYFTLGPGGNQNFPMTYLKRNPYNIVGITDFTINYLNDSWMHLQMSITYTSASIRIFHLISVAILGSFIVLSFILFLFRSHIHIKNLPVFFLFHINKLFNQHHQKYMYGRIIDEANNPISRAIIEIEDADTKTILMEANSNKSGRFYIRNIYTVPVNILVIKEGFAPSSVVFNKQTNSPVSGLSIILEKGSSHHKSVLKHLLEGAEGFLGLLFEVSLVVSIVIEMLYISLYGIEKTIPYFVLSLLNICLWLFYLREMHTK